MIMGAIVSRSEDVEAASTQVVLRRSVEKSRVTAGALAVVFGIIGAHKFYMGKTGQGVVYLLTFWTLVPCVLGVVEGVRYLTESDESFARRLGSGKVVEDRRDGVVGTVGDNRQPEVGAPQV